MKNIQKKCLVCHEPLFTISGKPLKCNEYVICKDCNKKKDTNLLKLKESVK